MRIVMEKKQFDLLLCKVKQLRLGERKINLNKKITLILRYATVRLDNLIEDEVQFPRLDPDAKNEDVVSLVFDVTGLDPKYVTQVEFSREESEYVVYLVPNRPTEKVNSFLSEIGSIS